MQFCIKDEADGTQQPAQEHRAGEASLSRAAEREVCRNGDRFDHHRVRAERRGAVRRLDARRLDIR